MPVRASADALQCTWIDFEIQRDGERTYHNSLFTSLKVDAHYVAAIARAGRARWKIENETFNRLARHGYHLKHNFGHSQNGLANLLATLNLFAFTLHEVLDCVADLWQQCRSKAGTRRRFFDKLRVLTEMFWFPDWTALLRLILHPPRRPRRSRSRGSPRHDAAPARSGRRQVPAGAAAGRAPGTAHPAAPARLRWRGGACWRSRAAGTAPHGRPRASASIGPEPYSQGPQI